MDRLTRKTSAGIVNFKMDDKIRKDQIARSAFYQLAAERLAAYEDTGLEPDKIPQLKAQLESALEDLYYIHCAGQKGCTICRNADQCGESDSHIGDCTGFEWRSPQPPKEEK